MAEGKVIPGEGLDPGKTHIDIRFQEWLGKWFIILMWQPENKQALVMRANLELDQARRERIQALFVELTKELG